MISAVRGILQAQGPDWVAVRVGGITLHIAVPASLVQELGETGQEVRLHTRLIIRDDEPQLYGFPSPEALRFFYMLTGVSGIGPRIALNLLSARTPEALAAAIMTGDLESFTGVSGIGKKGAARIILELRGKLEKDEFIFLPSAVDSTDTDAISALTALGYTAAEARKSLSAIGDPAGLDLEERVRRALASQSGY